MNARTPLYRMTERMVGGDLAGKLRSFRAEGESYEAIARYLHAEYGSEVTGQTLRMWGRQLGIPAPDADSEPDQAAS